MKHRSELATGSLRARLAAVEWAPVVESLLLEREWNELETRELLGARVVVKRSRLHGKSALRHALRACCGVEFPRLREFRNLQWLRQRLFEAPRPLFAAVLLRGGLPRQQLLATEELSGTRELSTFLQEREPQARPRVLERLALEAARLHALGFVHRDLYPRNLLVTESGLALLDAWRGGPGFDLRGPTHDLACLMLHGASWLSEEEQHEFFSRYFEARRNQGRPVDDRSRFARSLERHRARMIGRLERRPHERRGLEPPSALWRVPRTD